MIAPAPPNNGRPDDYLHTLDFSECTFPSDAISIAQMRQVHPLLFDVGIETAKGQQPVFMLAPFDGGHVLDTIGMMLHCERIIAADSYAAKLGLEPPDADIELFKEELANYYIKYGLAKGEHHAQELVRNIERMGASLAKGRQP
jgi:hypothetical protein